MKTTCLLIAAIIISTCAQAQKRIKFSLGPEFSLPTYEEFTSNGIGASATVELRATKKLSATLDVGHNHFSGTVVNPFYGDTTRGFGITPVLFGLKLDIANNFYAGIRGGLAFGPIVTYCLSPAAGVVFPNNKNPRIDIGARLIGVMGMPTFPEKAFIERGGYSYINFRAAIVF